MDGSIEVIAVVLGDIQRALACGATRPRCAVPGPSRRTAASRLEPVESEEEFERAARTTGCFRRGKPIHDPETHEVIGYEMEQVPLLRAAAPAKPDGDERRDAAARAQ